MLDKPGARKVAIEADFVGFPIGREFVVGYGLDLAHRYRGLPNGDDIPRTTQIILSFDDEFDEFSRKLQQLSKEWEASGLREGPR